MAATPLSVIEAAPSRPRPFDDDSPVDVNGNGNGNGKLPMIGGKVVDPVEVAAEVEEMGAEEAIAWAIERFHPSMRFAVSFQKTSSVTVDIAHAIEPTAKFFYLDTEVLFDETYETRDALAERYGIAFERFSGISLEQQEAEHGPALWSAHPDACCEIRKVEPMKEALAGIDCWVSGIRRADSKSRAGAAKFGWDKRFGLWKLNPLADWTEEEIWERIRAHRIPYNPLHDQGYPSIGCTHCTLRPGEGEGDRAGRWAGIDKNECGIN